MNRKQIVARIETDAPLCCAASWDNSGIQIRGTREEISCLAIALDPSPETIFRALEHGADFILTHHPLGLTPRFPNKDDDYRRILNMLMRSGAWLYAAHTTLDSQPDGPPAWLARALGLQNTQVLETTGEKTSLLIRIHSQTVPEIIRHPKIINPTRYGDTHEFVVWKHEWPGVRQDLQALFGLDFSWQAIALHEPSRSLGFGCIGDLSHPTDWPGFTSRLSALLGKKYWTRIGSPPEQISRIAYCPGSGASLAQTAFDRGAQIYITGDIKYHQALEIENTGLTLDVGHHVLEEKMIQVWYEKLQQDFRSHDIECIFLPGHDPLCIEPGGIQ
jgi:dinuclear metal center YbgI/SA1388 family protein